MSLYYVTKPNDYYRQGTILKTSGMGMVRPVLRDATGGIIPEEEGIALPLKDVRGYVLRIQNEGMDDGH